MSDKSINIGVGFDSSGVKSGMGEAAAAIEKGSDQMAKATAKATEASGNSLKSLQQNYRATYKAAQILAEQQGTNSDAFREAATAAAAYKDKLEDVQDAIKAASPEQKWRLLGGAISGAAQTAQGFVGVLSLIGVESESAEKSIQQMLALQGIASAASGVLDLVDAFKALDMATKATLIGAGLAIAAYAAYSMAAEDTAEVNKRLAASFKEIEDGEKKINDIVNKTTEMRIAAMKDGKEKEIAVANFARDKEMRENQRAFNAGEIALMTYNERQFLIKQKHTNDLADIEKRANEKSKSEQEKAQEAKLKAYTEGMAVWKSMHENDLDWIEFNPVIEPGELGEVPEGLREAGDAMKFYGQTAEVAAIKHASFLEAIGLTEAKAEEVKKTLQHLALDGFGQLANIMGQAIGGADDIGQQMFQMLAGLAKSLGSALLLMGSGLSIAFPTMSIPMLAAGAALIAASGVISAMTSNSAVSGSTGGSSSGRASYPSNNYKGGSSMGMMGAYTPQPVLIQVDGLVRGNNIIISQRNQTAQNGRVR